MLVGFAGIQPNIFTIPLFSPFCNENHFSFTSKRQGKCVDDKADWIYELDDDSLTKQRQQCSA